MSTEKHDLLSEEYLRKLVAKQFALSCTLFALFLLILLGIPLLNLLAPQFMNARLFGFTFTWFFLAVLIYPITWLISWVYVKFSTSLEEDAVNWAESGNELSNEPKGRRTT